MLDSLFPCISISNLFLSRFYNENVQASSTTDLRWMRGPNCAGHEARLDQCPGINIANVSGCFILSHAAVFCYKETSMRTGLV